MEKKEVVTETYRMLKKVEHFGVEYGVQRKNTKEAKWLSDLKEEMVELEQQNLAIKEGKVNKQCSKMPNWKAPGHDGVQVLWIKRLDKMHERIATQLNELLEGTKEIHTSWMTYGRTVLCQKDPVKGNLVENFRPITCLPFTYRCYFRGYVLFHGKRKLTARGAKGLQEEK